MFDTYIMFISHDFLSSLFSLAAENSYKILLTHLYVKRSLKGFCSAYCFYLS